MNFNNNKNFLAISLTQNLTQNAVIASVYIVLSLFLAPLTYGPIQMRVAEILTLLPFINPSLSIGVVIGCLITNIASPYGMLDIVIGTLSTAATVYFVSKSKNLLLSTFWPVFFTLPVAFVISFGNMNMFLFNAFTIALGEFITVTIAGYLVLKVILKNEKLVRILKGQSEVKTY